MTQLEQIYLKVMTALINTGEAAINEAGGFVNTYFSSIEDKYIKLEQLPAEANYQKQYYHLANKF